MLNSFVFFVFLNCIHHYLLKDWGREAIHEFRCLRYGDSNVFRLVIIAISGLLISFYDLIYQACHFYSNISLPTGSKS